MDSDSIAQALISAGAKVERLTAHLPKGTTDDVWLTLAGTNDWVVLTRDKANSVPATTGGNVTIKETAGILAAAIPRIAEVCAKEAGPFVYHIGASGTARRMD